MTWHLKILALTVPALGLAQAVLAQAAAVSVAPHEAPGKAAVASGEATGQATLSDAQAQAAFDAARKSYKQAVVSDGKVPQDLQEVVILGDPAQRLIAGSDNPTNASLENIRLVIDVDNTTLRDVFADIVTQAADYTGPWMVKWRLKPDNMQLLDERVNLTAEAPFGEFVSLLAERVKNMTGVQLYVTAFAESRVILVTDTYY